MSKRIKSSKNPGVRHHMGNAIESAAKVVNHPGISEKLNSFLEINGQLVSANGRTQAAMDSLESQLRLVSEGNDAATQQIEKLARLLSVDGMPRRNPSEPFGLPSPSILKRASGEALVANMVALANAIVTRSGLSEATLSSAKSLQEMSASVSERLHALPAFQDAYEKALFERDAVARSWDQKLRSLRLATKSADEDGAGNLHAQLFGSIAFSHRKASPLAPEPKPPSQGEPTPPPLGA